MLKATRCPFSGDPESRPAPAKGEPWRTAWGVGLLLALLAAAAPAQPTTQPATVPDGGVGDITAWVRRAQLEAAAINDAVAQNAAMWEVVRLCVRAGDEESARKIADLLAIRPHRFYFQELVAVERARKGDFASAVKTAEAIDSEQYRLDTLVQIIQAQGLARDFAGATALADKFDNAAWKARAYGEIAAAQALAGNFSAAREIANSEAISRQPDKKEAARKRNELLSSIAELQALAGDEHGAMETAAEIGRGGKNEDPSQMAYRLQTESAIQDSKSEAAFRKAWKALPGSERWPLPSVAVIDGAARAMLFDSLAAAVSARTEAEYEKAISTAAGIASRIIFEPRPRRTRDGTIIPPPPDPTIMQRGLAYTLIAAVEAARNDADGARALIMRAITVGQSETRNDLFTGTCGPILASMLIKLGNADLAVDYALGLQKGHPLGHQVARAVGYALAEQGKGKELADYMDKLKEPTHKAHACLGVVSRIIDARRK